MTSTDSTVSNQPSWLVGPARGTPARTRYGELAQFREGLYRLSPSAYAWMVPNGSWGETNIGLIDCNGKSVLVDTCWDLHYTHEMLTVMQPVLARSPIELVINTHSDGDHCWGNQLFSDREIIATQACIAHIHHHPPKTLNTLKQSGRVLRHVPLLGLDKFGHYMSAMLAPYDFSEVCVTPPTQGFVHERVVTVNGVDLVLTEVGPAHTAGDLFVHVPSERVVYSGDVLFVGVTPVMWAGPVARLVAALKRLLALDCAVIVPGHGALARRADVQAALDYWEFAQTGIARCHQQGMSPADAARATVKSADFARHPFATWDSPERMVTNAYTLYREWGSGAELPGALGVIDLMRRQATLAFELPHASPRCMRHF